MAASANNTCQTGRACWSATSYGQRLSNEDELDRLYSDLGEFVRKKASGWQLWLLSGNPKLTGALRLKPQGGSREQRRDRLPMVALRDPLIDQFITRYRLSSSNQPG